MELETMEFNQEKADAMYQERLARCTPIAKKVLEIVVSHLGEVTLGENKDVSASMMPVAKEVLGFFLQEKVHWTDKEFIIQLVLQPLAQLGAILETSNSISWDKYVGKKIGKDVLDLTFEDVDNGLKS